ncbi:MAG: MurR/RpiR family transcriptional regulator [Alphaproteobacteria bacterium]|nr:MurR/RpiR family transcriptional regulator [Alphaproteobacteria bacterium]
MPRLTDRSAKRLVESRPTDFDTLKDAISERYDTLSKRLQQVAEYALAHPDDIALETIAVIASRAKVPPSSLIRFSKALGFDGFTRMQRLFRDRLVARAPSYGERIRRLSEERRSDDRPMSWTMLHDMAASGIEGLERLRQEVPLARLESAIGILGQARLIHVVAQRRAFPVASYLTYLLNELDRPTRLLDGIGGMLDQQGRAISPDDALVAISFQPYAADVAALVERCQADGVPLIGITDGPLSPLARLADVSFEVVESEAHGFRALSATMCLALTLAVSLGHHLAAEHG